ncbi:hypothetical protein ACIA5A_17605 [Micromonospora sp. NPDC051300]|uniref:hypothetical protein n=1 Tax=Micromonospora sp. NPDC051300 TaxID=3364286 RepID=UPI003791FB4B
MRSRTARAATVLVTVLSALLVLFACAGFLPFAAPTAPCPNESADHFQQARILTFWLLVAMLLAAVLSLALALTGGSGRSRNPWPWLAASVLAMAVSASLIMPVDRVGSC